MKHGSLGVAGLLTRAFIASPLTPLFLVAALALGLVALGALPREEEPQISVPMVDIHLRAEGLSADDAVKLVTEPLETIVKSIADVEHVYSQTRDNGAMVTARFVVGTPSDAAILRVHEKIRANMDRIPVGIPEPLVVGRGIDDVAIVVLTMTPKPDAAHRWTPNDLSRVMREMRVEIARVENVGLTYLVGEQPEEIRIAPDPERLAKAGLTLQALAAKIEGANRAFPAGQIRDKGQQIALMAGQTLASIEEIGNLTVTHSRWPPGLSARCRRNLARNRNERSARGASGAAGRWQASNRAPAVSLAIAKRAGANAVTIAHAVIAAAERLKIQRHSGRSHAAHHARLWRNGQGKGR